jgi:hypothetical protein
MHALSIDDAWRRHETLVGGKLIRNTMKSPSTFTPLAHTWPARRSKLNLLRNVVVIMTASVFDSRRYQIF